MRLPLLAAPAQDHPVSHLLEARYLLRSVPLDFEVADAWVQKVEASLRKQETWLHYLFLGTHALEVGNAAGALQLLTRSMQLQKSVHAQRALALLAPTADAFVGGYIKGEWPATPKLRLYQIPFTGYDWIGPGDVPAGCQVCNTFEHETTIAEYVLCAMLEWEFGIAESDRQFRANGWTGRRIGYGPTHGELYGKTIGIVGYGHIGQEVARRAEA